MPNELVLSRGFLPLATEGGFDSTNTVHFPANIGVLKPAVGGRFKRAEHDIFVYTKDNSGDYELVKGGFKIDAPPTAGSGEVVGVYGDSSIDKNTSGISIGAGVDIGAGYDADSLEKLKKYIEPNSRIHILLDNLALATGKIGMDAVRIYPTVKAQVAPYLPLQPQEILDLGYAVWKKKEEGLSKPKCWSVMHIALREVILRAYFSSNVRGNAVKNAIDATNITQYPITDGDNTNFIQQCNCVLSALKAENFDSTFANEKPKKIAILKGLIGYVEGIKAQLEQGVKIKVEDRPTQLSEVTSPQGGAAQLVTFAIKAQMKHKGKGAEEIARFEYSKEANKDIQTAVYSKHYLAAQQKLNALGFTDDNGKKLEEDGNFGSCSKAALKKFQKNKGLNASGNLDDVTLQALLGTKVNPSPNPQPNPQPKPQPNAQTQWDKMQELFNAQKQYPQIAQSSWWQQLQSLISGGWNAFLTAFGVGMDWVDLAYNKYQDFLRQQQAKTQPQPNPNPYVQLLTDAFKGKGSIGDSVGAGGKNNPKDVLIVRGLLFARGYLPQDARMVLGVKENFERFSKSDNELENAIRRFQSEKAAMANPDGRVDAGGTTLAVLNGAAPKPKPQPIPNNEEHSVVIENEEEELSVEPISPDMAVFGCFN